VTIAPITSVRAAASTTVSSRSPSSSARVVSVRRVVDAVTGLDAAGQFLAPAIGQRDVVLGQLAPLLLDLAPEQLPVAGDAVPGDRAGLGFALGLAGRGHGVLPLVLSRGRGAGQGKDAGGCAEGSKKRHGCSGYFGC
jgi:hypothetical protein